MNSPLLYASMLRCAYPHSLFLCHQAMDRNVCDPDNIGIAWGARVYDDGRG